MNRQMFFVSMAFVGLMIFQNCDETAFKFRMDGNNNGMPYDGKPYMVAGSCSDGSNVHTKIILMANSQGVMVRKNCADLDVPVFFNPGQYQLDPADQNHMTANGMDLMSTP